MTADGIFISYQKDDREIANALKIAFGQLIPGISIFLDHVSLEGGDEYETKIKESIGDTKLFILICSGSLKSKDMSWCYYAPSLQTREISVLRKD
jgi:TIR domain